MLVRACAGAKPPVIGQVEQPFRTFPRSRHRRPAEIAAEVAIKPPGLAAARNRVARENDLVADQRQEVRGPRRCLVAATIAGDEPTPYLGELHQTESLEQVLKRQILAEWHEVDLVVDRKDRAAVADYVDRVVGARHGSMGRRSIGRTDRAGDERRSLWQELCDLCKRIRFAHEEEGKRRFRPDQKSYVAQARGL